MKNKKKVAVMGFALAAAVANILQVVFLDCHWVTKALLCLAVDALALLCMFNVESLLRVPLEIYRDRAMFLTLVKNDFQARFAGSYLGLFWAFVQPVILICLYWFVFQVGLRSGSVSNHPFILFLMTGLVPWFYFSESWSGATNVLLEYNYLVKKVVFNVGFLPALKVCSALFVHLFFLAILTVLSLIYGYGIHPYLLQLVYYMFGSALLVLGLSYATAAFTVFFRDMSQIVGIVLTIGIWMTPIMWNAEATIPGALIYIFKLNPMYYIVDGFRDCFLNGIWFWQKPVWTIYFWCVTVAIYLLGVKLFNRLKVHFSDVL